MKSSLVLHFPHLWWKIVLVCFSLLGFERVVFEKEFLQFVWSIKICLLGLRWSLLIVSPRMWEYSNAHQERKEESALSSQACPNRWTWTKDAAAAPGSLRRWVCTQNVSRDPGLITVQGNQNFRTRHNGMYEWRLTPLITSIPWRVHFFSASSGHFNGSLEMLYVRSEFVRPRKGLRPKVSSYAHTPNDHQSMLHVYPLLFSILSGLWQVGKTVCW